ncbi:MAG: hypothetical protein HY307_03500 [Arcobacter sp.]|nr:hypothetical protein [Arcobacter sp.]
MNFFTSLRFKLIAFSIIIEVVMLSLLITNNARLIESHLTEQAKFYLQDKKSNFKASILPLLIARDYGSLNSLLEEYTSSKKITFIFIKKDDQIIASSNWDNKNTNIPISQEFNTDNGTFYTKTNITFGGQNYGDVYFGINTTFLKNAPSCSSINKVN